MMTIKQVGALIDDVEKWAKDRRNDEDEIRGLAERVVKFETGCVHFGMSKEDIDTVEDIMYYLTEDTHNFCRWLSELCIEYVEIARATEAR